MQFIEWDAWSGKWFISVQFIEWDARKVIYFSAIHLMSYLIWKVVFNQRACTKLVYTIFLDTCLFVYINFFDCHQRACTMLVYTIFLDTCLFVYINFFDCLVWLYIPDCCWTISVATVIDYLYYLDIKKKEKFEHSPRYIGPRLALLPLEGRKTL